jgi:hypothetical protein
MQSKNPLFCCRLGKGFPVGSSFLPTGSEEEQEEACGGRGEEDLSREGLEKSTVKLETGKASGA